MAFFGDINTDYCPKCKAQVQGIGSCECITDDSRCSSCGVPLKSARVEVISPTDAPYTISAIEIDMH